jgi:hypothetical protein
MNQATQTGADPDIKEGEVAVNVGMSPRNIALRDIEDRQDESRIAQIAADIEGDPGAQALAARMQEAQDAARATAVANGELPPLEVDPDGAATRQKMHPEQAAAPAALPEEPAAPTAVPAELQDDPLADHIVMDGDQPMFALKVNGENLLMPLAEARKRLQIGTAAEIRMQNAALREKTLDERERVITIGEQALAARTTAPVVQSEIQPQPTPQPGLSEEVIRSRANDVMTEAFTGSEENAGKKLSNLLLEMRAPQVQAAAPIDTTKIVQQAASAAVSAVNVMNDKRDLVSGLETFENKYPEIMGDVRLYNMADNMTGEIAIEHPTWSKSQGMIEAGKRVREWVENLKGTGSTETIIDDPVITENETISEHTLPPTTQIRQERKRELVQIPQAASATQPAPEPEERPQTPTEALDAERRARGQPVSSES